MSGTINTQINYKDIILLIWLFKKMPTLHVKQ